MLISEFIQLLQDVYDEEGDMEIAIKIDDNDLGSEPIVVKSTVYEQLYHTELFWKGIHSEEEIVNLIKNDSFLSKQFKLNEDK